MPGRTTPPRPNFWKVWGGLLVACAAVGLLVLGCWGLAGLVDRWPWVGIPGSIILGTGFAAFLAAYVVDWTDV